MRMYEVYNPKTANILGYFYSKDDAIDFCRGRKYHSAEYRACEIFHDGIDIIYETNFE